MTASRVPLDAQVLTERAQRASPKDGKFDLLARGDLTMGAGATYDGLSDDTRRTAERFVRRKHNRHACVAPWALRRALRLASRRGPLDVLALGLAARIQANPERSCGDPRHEADLADVRTVLRALGLAAVPAPDRTEAGTQPVQARAVAYGRCPVCHLRRNLRADGTLTRHGDCLGAGRRPEDADPEEAACLS